MDRRCRLPVAAFQPRRAFGIREKSGLGAFIAVSFLFGGFCFADTAELPTSRDNSLFEPEPPFDFNSAEANKSNGAGDFIFTGQTKQGVNGLGRRALVAFDVAGAIPSGATITDVFLRLYLSQAITQPSVIVTEVALHRVVSDWGEADSDASGQEGGGANAQPDDATWVHAFFNTQNWSEEGGDFVAIPSAFLDVGTRNLFYTWNDIGMVDDVQFWLDNPSQNFGWIILGDESMPGTAKRFDSRESFFFDSSSGLATAPLLTIEFSVGSDVPVIASPPPTQLIPSGGSATIGFSVAGPGPFTFQWYQGVSGDTANPVGDATASTFTTPALSETGDFWLRVSNAQGSANSGTVSLVVPEDTSVSPHLIAGSADLVNDGTEFQGFIYNGFEINSRVASFSSDPGTITRISFLDPDGDLVFAEFGSDDPATILTITLEDFQATVPSPYNQPGTTYAQGSPTFTIENSTPLTFFSTFTLGNDSDRVDVSLINSQTFDGAVDGIADVRLIRVVAPDGAFVNIGGINAANANFEALSGVIGLDAEDANIENFLFVGDIEPLGNAFSWLRLLSQSFLPEILINGGDLREATGSRQIDTNGFVYPFLILATDGQWSISNSPLRPDLGDGALAPVSDTFAANPDLYFATDGQSTGIAGN